jgi:hypothetical protein
LDEARADVSRVHTLEAVRVQHSNGSQTEKTFNLETDIAHLEGALREHTDVLTELQRRGVIVAVEGDILCLKPRRALDDVLLARIREAKPAILEALRNGLAACGSGHCANCYDVGDGRKIHPPKCGEDYLGWFKRWEGRGCRMQ